MSRSKRTKTPSYKQTISGEEMSDRRVHHLNRCKHVLKKAPTKQERMFLRSWSAVGDRRFGQALWLKRQKLFPVTEEIAFFVDFYSKPCKLVIEIDGRHHLFGTQRQEDIFREQVLAERHVKVIRFQNHRIEDDMPRVLREVVQALYRRACLSHKRAIVRQLRSVRDIHPKAYHFVFPSEDYFEAAVL